MFKFISTIKRSIMGINIKKVMADNSRSIEDRVKIAILWENGDDNPDPASIADTKKKMSDYSFSTENYISITKHFNISILAVNPGAAKISVVDVQNFGTIQDCIDGVTAATK